MNPPEITLDDKINAAANEIFKQQHDFDNTEFRYDTIDEVIKRIKVLVKKEWISPAWFDSVYEAISNNWPVYINLCPEWNWNFLTIKNPNKTRDDIIKTLAEMHGKPIEVVQKDQNLH